MSEAGARWYAVRTRSRAEKKVVRVLEDRAIEAYCPLIERERRWSDRTTKVAFPLFPGYIFARFGVEDILRVLQTPGVATVVRSGGRPAAVRPEELDAVRKLEEGVAETGEVPDAVDFLEPGDSIRVVRGPFEGMQGVLLESEKGTRVAVRLSAIRQAVAVRLARDDVELLQPSRSS